LYWELANIISYQYGTQGVNKTYLVFFKVDLGLFYDLFATKMVKNHMFSSESNNNILYFNFNRWVFYYIHLIERSVAVTMGYKLLS